MLISLLKSGIILSFCIVQNIMFTIITFLLEDYAAPRDLPPFYIDTNKQACKHVSIGVDIHYNIGAK